MIMIVQILTKDSQDGTLR